MFTGIKNLRRLLLRKGEGKERFNRINDLMRAAASDLGAGTTPGACAALRIFP